MMCFKKYYPALLIVAVAFGCSQTEPDKPEIAWAGNKAVEIILSSPEIIELPGENLSKSIEVKLGNSGEAMLGQFLKRDGRVVFQPVVPFSRGMHYHVLLAGIIITEFDIPLNENAKTPELLIFPSTDTLPENILKMYLSFSEPMAEGKSIQYIFLVNSKGDTLDGTFLDLQPELWNDEGTVLTLWFDPGRIKRDLIPNKTMGNPIIKGNEYTLHVSGNWKSKSGKEIGIETMKKFRVTERDEKIPDVSTWTLNIPKGNTSGELIVHFPEPLDFSLIQSAIQILDSHGASIDGVLSPINEERGIRFKPLRTWKNGLCALKVESRLEDLAGNNLQRPFDRDITKGDGQQEKKYFEKKFRIE